MYTHTHYTHIYIYIYIYICQQYKGNVLLFLHVNSGYANAPYVTLCVYCPFCLKTLKHEKKNDVSFLRYDIQTEDTFSLHKLCVCTNV